MTTERSRTSPARALVSMGLLFSLLPVPACAIDVPITPRQMSEALQYGRVHDYLAMSTSAEWLKFPFVGPKHTFLQIISPFLSTTLCPAERHTQWNDSACLRFAREHSRVVNLAISFESRSAADNMDPHVAIVQNRKATPCHPSDVSALTDDRGRMVRTYTCEFTAPDGIDWRRPFDVVVTNIAGDGFAGVSYHIHADLIR